MQTRLYHAMHTVDAHLGVRLFIVVVAFVAVRSSVWYWRLHRSCNPIRGVSEPESRRDTGRRGAERQEKQQREAKIAPAAPGMRIFGLPLAPLSQA